MRTLLQGVWRKGNLLHRAHAQVWGLKREIQQRLLRSPSLTCPSGCTEAYSDTDVKPFTSCRQPASVTQYDISSVTQYDIHNLSTNKPERVQCNEQHPSSKPCCHVGLPTNTSPRPRARARHVPLRPPHPQVHR